MIFCVKFHGFSCIFMNSYWFSWIFMDFHGFSWIFMDFIGFHGMSWIALGWDILADFGGIQLIIFGGVWVPLAFVGSVGLFALPSRRPDSARTGTSLPQVFLTIPDRTKRFPIYTQTPTGTVPTMSTRPAPRRLSSPVFPYFRSLKNVAGIRGRAPTHVRFSHTLASSVVFN